LQGRQHLSPSAGGPLAARFRGIPGFAVGVISARKSFSHDQEPFETYAW
jgi:hypothetical protein